MKPGHDLESHTADVALRAWGSTATDVFEQAALAMVGLMYDRESVKPLEQRHVDLHAPDAELLLAAWLNELIYLFEAKTFLGHRFHVQTLEMQPGSVRLRATVTGERNADGRHAMRDVVKAATLHALQLRQREGGWEGHVLLDV